MGWYNGHPDYHDAHFDLSVDKVAVVGVGCRFPGAETPEEYWRLLRDGVDAIREVPTDAKDPPLASAVPASGCALVYDRKGGNWGYGSSGGASVQDSACMYHRITLALGSS